MAEPGRIGGVGGFTHAVYQLRTEGEAPLRQALAIGAGLFIGATPFYGFHLALCVLVGSLFGLNRIKLYLAANISNPLFAPFLVFLEIQAGALALHGRLEPLRLSGLELADAWTFAQELLAGSLLVGLGLGVLGGAGTWLLVARGGLPGSDRARLDAAARRYLTGGLVAWEFASGKLRHDPMYLALLRHPRLPREGTLLDLGCGQGLFFALLAGEGSAVEMVGLDSRPRQIHLARLALGDRARFAVADLASAELPPARAVLLLDVLHYLPREAQERLLARVAAALEPGGVLFLREADAAGGGRFWLVRASERLRALLRGRPGQRFAYRNAGEWTALLERLGFAVEPADEAGARGSPFANRLLAASAGA